MYGSMDFREPLYSIPRAQNTSIAIWEPPSDSECKVPHFSLHSTSLPQLHAEPGSKSDEYQPAKTRSWVVLNKEISNQGTGEVIQEWLRVHWHGRHGCPVLLTGYCLEQKLCDRRPVDALLR